MYYTVRRRECPSEKKKQLRMNVSDKYSEMEYPAGN